MARENLSLPFQRLPSGTFGEIIQAALLWNRGGTVTLDRLRTLSELHLLVMCLEGRSDYLDETGVSLTLQPGDVVLIPRNLAHSYRPTPGFRWSEIFIFFRGSLPDLWWSSRFLQPGTNLVQAQPLRHWAQRLCHLFKKAGNSAMAVDGQLSTLQSWLAELKNTENPAPDSGETWFALACRELDQGSLRQPDLKKLARSLGLSYESFRKDFAAKAGLSPGHYRTNATIRKACNLLNDGQLSLKEIAEQLDFSDEFHFSRAFRQHIGLPPGQYRSAGTFSREKC